DIEIIFWSCSRTMAKEKQPSTTATKKKTSRSKKTEISAVSSTPTPAIEIAAAAPAHVTVMEVNGHIDIDAIRRRAFQLYEERGRIHGYEVEDWFRAEQELRSEKKSA